MKNILLASLLFTSFCTTAQQLDPLLSKTDPEAQQQWVDSIYGNMTLQEKVGQLFMGVIFSEEPPATHKKIEELIKNYHLGGLIFSKGGPFRQARLNNRLQDASKLPMLIAMDAEWGLAMRLDSTFAYPYNMTLGAVRNNQLIEQAGKRIGEHTKRLGMHINFAPVVDININPKNPIIGNRSFGEDRDNVTQKAAAFMKGLQSAGVLANAKHFPGHGDTATDSHKSLPTLDFTRERLDSIEMYPYSRLINEGLSSVMVAHLNIPALEPRDGFPSSISPAIVTDILKGSLGFNGLIFTDALNMKGASNFEEPGEIDLAAFLAGNDVLLISEDIPKAHARIIKAFRESVISEARLALSVKKILKAKFLVGLNDYAPVVLDNLYEDLNSPEDDALYEQIIESAITVVKNDSLTLPIVDLVNTEFAYINFGDDSGDAFYQQLKKYGDISWIKASSLESYMRKLAKYDYVIAGFHKSNANPWKSFAFSAKELDWLKEIAQSNKIILNVFASPYSLLDLDSTSNFESIIVSYQNSKVSQQVSAQMIFGARSANGKLPVQAGANFPANTGLEIKAISRLQYGTPESVGVDSQKLKKIDTLAQNGVWAGYMPGAQILVARKGKVIYNKTFGYHTPDKKIKVKESDIYDVASLTKILATLPMVMELADRDRINLETTLGEMIPAYKESNKSSITLKRMMSHSARLKAWIPFYINTIDQETELPSELYYRKQKSDSFSLKVANQLYMRGDFPDSIYKKIRESELRTRKGYKYSDLSFYILKNYLESFYGTTLDTMATRFLYDPLGANYSMFKPLRSVSLSRIPPTEEDDYFRMQRVQGYVHDQGAAMLGGVSGHAGLFSNSNDIAKIMQMYLWEGYYGGKRYLKPETIDMFNTCYFCEDDIRRGVGFDKPQLGDSGPTCGCVSMLSFGHSGFTGTLTWADPDQEIVYVFLSNRTFPTADNRMIISSNLRSRIQQVIYDSILPEE